VADTGLPDQETSSRPKVQPGRGVAVAAVVVAVLFGFALGGLVVAVTRRREHVTSVGCVATTVARRGLPSVVTLHVQTGAGAGAGSGSGEVISPDGYVLTNNHVISAAATGGTITLVFNDGVSTQARLVGRDVATDLAVVKVENHDDLKPIPWGASSKLVVGQPVVALGAPLGLSSTVTTGIVSALNRSVNVPADNGRTALLVAAIQTDAAINPGNSGGALVDCAGRLVGIPTAGATVPQPQGGSSAGNIGIGFAIPSEYARMISDELIAHGEVTHSFFGVQVAPVSTGASPAAPSPRGLYVVGVTPGGPSAAAGIQQGDVITKLDGVAATSAEQLEALTLTKRPAETVPVTIERAGVERTLEVTLGSQPPPS
jgi:putative serine protease PepD